MPFTLGQAAIATGVNKSTIFRAIKAGRLSAQRDDNGQYQIEPAELHRIFAPLPTSAPLHQPPSPLDAMTTMLVEALRKTIVDLQQDRDHWRSEVALERTAHAETRAALAAAQRLLPAPMPPAALVKAPVRKRMIWRSWRRSA